MSPELQEDMALEEAAMTTDQAFQSAMTPNILGVDENGKPRILYPFSLRRKTLYGELMGTAGSPMHRAIIMAWVCSRTGYELFIATLDRAQAQDDAYVWAEKNGVTYEEPSAVIQIYKKINDELFASSQVQEDNKGPESPNSGGPPEN